MACSNYGFNLVFIHEFKAEAVAAVYKEFVIIENRYNGKPVFIRINRERALGKTFEALLAEKGIIYKPLSPYTPEQNGHFERIGKTLVIKARAIQIQAGLSFNL